MAKLMHIAVVFVALFSTARADCAEQECPAQASALIQRSAEKTYQDPTVADETIDLKEVMAAAQDTAQATTAAPPQVFTLNSYIGTKLLPKAAAATRMLQEKIDEARQAVDNCDPLHIQAAQPGKLAAEANLNRQQRKLAMCLRVKNGDTIKEEEFCEEWHAAAKNFNPKTLDNAKGNLKTYENILKTYYDFYPKFMKEEAKCREMIAIMHSQDKHCSFRVGEINNVYCALKENRTKLCGGYDGCYAGAVSDYTWTRDKATKLEAHTKKTYKALECFKAASDSLSFAKSIDHPVEQDGQQAAVKSIKCDPSQYTTEHLDLQYHDVPLKETCSKEIVAPGKYPSWCSWEPATTATTTIGIASQGPSGGPATAATYSLIQDHADVDTTSFSKVEEYLADAEATLKKME